MRGAGAEAGAACLVPYCHGCRMLWVSESGRAGRGCKRVKVVVSNRYPRSTLNERLQSKKNSNSTGGVGCDGRCDERRWSKGVVIDGEGGESEEEGLKGRARAKGTSRRRVH